MLNENHFTVIPGVARSIVYNIAFISICSLFGSEYYAFTAIHNFVFFPPRSSAHASFWSKQFPSIQRGLSWNSGSNHYKILCFHDGKWLSLLFWHMKKCCHCFVSVNHILSQYSKVKSSSFWVFKDYCHLLWTLISDPVNGRKLDMAISVAYLKSWIELMVVYMPSNDPTIRSECRVKGWNCSNSAHIFHSRHVCKFVTVVARFFVCWALLLRHLFRILSSLYASN